MIGVGSVVSTASGKTAWVFQNPHGQPRRSALDHVAYPALAAGGSRADANEQAIAVLGLWPEARCSDQLREPLGR